MTVRTSPLKKQIFVSQHVGIKNTHSAEWEFAGIRERWKNQAPAYVFTTQSCSKPSFLFANWTIQDYCLQTWLQTKFTERRVG